MNSIERQWRIFLKNIIENGEIHEKDDGDIIHESMINHCFIDNVLNQFGEQYVSTEMFLKLLKEGKFNINGYPIKDSALAGYVTSLDDENYIKNKYPDTEVKQFTYTYPQRIFNMTDRDSTFMVNQFNLMASRLIAIGETEKGLGYKDGSNRAVANVYSAVHDCDMNDIPCLNWMQFTIRDNKLVLHVMFRSNDCYGAFPSNMLLLTYLGLKMRDLLIKYYPLLKFEGINYNSTSLHIYESDIEQAKKVLEG